MQPLSGIKVLELGNFVSAPYCGKLFAGYGAEVIKIEPPDGDISRTHGPFKNNQPDPETSALFMYLNTGKRSVTLDLQTVTDHNNLIELIKQSDVLIENYRPNDAKALGIDYETLKVINPKLVVISITAYGQKGPYANYYSNNLIAVSYTHLTLPTNREV